MPNTYPTYFTTEGIQGESRSTPCTLALTNDIGTTGVIPFARFNGGSFTLPAAVAGVTFTFWSKSRNGGTFGAQYSDAQPPVATVRTVAASRSYKIPEELAGAYEIAIVSNVAGPETIELNLKHK